MRDVTEQAGGRHTEGETGTDDRSGAASGEDTGQQGSTAEGSSSQTSSSEGAASGTQADEGSSGSASQDDSSGGGDTAGRARESRGSEATRQRAEEPESAPRGRERRAPLNVGELVWKIASVLASAVRVVAYVVLTILAVNPQNGVAQVIGGIADWAVLAFRDLFLPADPTLAVVVDYGLAAIFWVLVGEFGSRLIRWIGARLS